MFAKVSNRARRRSAQEVATSSKEQQQLVVDRPPDLIRWCDFSDPFPSVARGGYARYYAGVTPQIGEAPKYCPLLSHFPGTPSATSREPPSQSPLFYSSRTPNRALGPIRETSMESLTPKRPTNLVVSTTSPTSLRRQHRRILRTPSIERDFAGYRAHLFSSTVSINTGSELLDVPPSSHSSEHSHSSSARSRSDSASSESNHTTESAHSEDPLTPATSLGSKDEDIFTRLILKEDCTHDRPQRPDSRASFSTARSGFSNA